MLYKCAILGGMTCTTLNRGVILGGYVSQANGGAVISGGAQNITNGGTIISGLYCESSRGIVTGIFNKNDSDIQNYFIIGNGTDPSIRSNAFRVTRTGEVYALSEFNSTGADYAKYLEWKDGNSNEEDRRGLMVTWSNEDKIKLANSGDDVIGIISAVPSIIGNSHDDVWHDMYQLDVFGQPIKGIVHHEALYVDVEKPDLDEDGNPLETTHIEKVLGREECDLEEYLINPDYNSEQEYIPRSQKKNGLRLDYLDN